MEFSGLIRGYRVDRVLSEQEKMHHLKQGQRLNLEPHYQLSVIKLNSHYLECVDKWFGWKGVLTAVMSIVIFIFSVGFLGISAVTLTSPPDLRPANESWMICAVIAAMIFPVIATAIWMLKKESFSYTHSPLHFHRVSRMVHVFRTNGTVLSVPWDKIFFTLGHLRQWNEWEVRGHVLGPDNLTVRETFSLSYVGSLATADTVPNVQYSSQDFVRAHWEFIRRYMEECPQAVSSQIQFCIPVDGRYESFGVGMERVFANFAGAPFLIYWMMFPFCLVVSIFRWFAMRTSKIPQWPQEIEDSCKVETDDPYAIEGAADGERVAVFPAAAQAAGAHFRARPHAVRPM